MKFGKKVGAVVSSLAIASLMVPMGITAAWGDDVPGATATGSKTVQEQVVLTKVIEASTQSKIAGNTFSFTITPLGLEDGKGALLTGDAAQAAPAFGDGTVTTPAAAAMTSDMNGMQFLTTTIPAGKWPTFSHAGVYQYRVTETGVYSNPSASSATSLSLASDATIEVGGNHYVPSTAAYLMRVYVVNDGSNLKVQEVTVNQEALDVPKGDTALSTDDTGEVDKKVNPTDPGTTEEGSSDPKGNGFKFTNRFSEAGAFTLSKVVTGDYGDKEKEFSFDVKLILPAHDLAAITSTTDGVGADNESGVKIIKATGMLGDSQDENAKPHFLLGWTKTRGQADSTATKLTNANEAEVKGVKLKNGTSLSIPNTEKLPVGTKFYIKEAGETGYVTSAKIVMTGAGESGADVEKSIAAGTSGAGITINDSSEYEVVRNGVMVTVTNNYPDDNVSPTGILISNLPYMLLIGIPVIALGAWFVVSRRRQQEPEV